MTLFCFKLTGYKAYACLQGSQTLLAFELGCSSWEGQINTGESSKEKFEKLLRA